MIRDHWIANKNKSLKNHKVSYWIALWLIMWPRKVPFNLLSIYQNARPNLISSHHSDVIRKSQGKSLEDHIAWIDINLPKWYMGSYWRSNGPHRSISYQPSKVTLLEQVIRGALDNKARLNILSDVIQASIKKAVDRMCKLNKCIFWTSHWRSRKLHSLTWY